MQSGIMHRILLTIGLFAVMGSVSGCKIVKNKTAEETTISAGQEGDNARNEIRLDETFEALLLPHIESTAILVNELRVLIATDLDKAGKAHANRGSGQGAAWNFSVKGEGKVVASKLDTRARTIGVDTDFDGQQDLTVQLGPVIRGTALRDVAPFYNFDDFRVQIEFAKLSRSLNDRIETMIAVPEDVLIGKTTRFRGVVPLKSATEDFVVTPVEITFSK